MSCPTTLPRMAYSMRETADMIGMSLRTLVRRVDDGTIRAVKVGKRVLIPAAEVERLLSGEAS